MVVELSTRSSGAKDGGVAVWVAPKWQHQKRDRITFQPSEAGDGLTTEAGDGLTTEKRTGLTTEKRTALTTEAGDGLTTEKRTALTTEAGDGLTIGLTIRNYY